MLKIQWLTLYVVLLLIYFQPARLQAEEVADPVGTDYLRTFRFQESPFGQLLVDGFPYDGVRMQRWRRQEPAAEWLLVWIDLRTPGLGYRISPVHIRTGPGGSPLQATYAQTTLDFLRSDGEPRIDLAINTATFYPFPATPGMPVFLNEPIWQGEDNQRDPVAGSLMLGLCPGRAILDEAEVVRQAHPQVAFGSFFGVLPPPESILVRHGKHVGKGERAHGRTAAGIDSTGRVLILLVADGYNPGVSVGLSAVDAATVLQAAGAQNAMFFDGGGSSTLVGRDAAGHPVVINRPSGLQQRPGTLRYVGVNLGFTGLRPGNDPLPSLPDWQAPFLARNWEEIILYVRVYPVQSTLILLGIITSMVLLLIRWRRRFRKIRQPNPSS